MRVKVKGVDAYGPPCTFEFNGKKQDGVIGDSIASALINSGEYGLRNTEGTEKRGVFCGMGVCNECLVNVNGEEKREGTSLFNDQEIDAVQKIIKLLKQAEGFNEFQSHRQVKSRKRCV